MPRDGQSEGWSDPLVRQAFAQVRRWRHWLHPERKTWSEKDIHRLRVETRRFLAHVALLESWLPKDVVHGVRRTLKRCLRVTSELRDLQVHAVLAELLQSRHPSMGIFRHCLRRRARRLARGLAKDLVRGRHARSLVNWQQQLRAAASGRRESEARDRRAARRRLRQAFHRLLRWQERADSDPAWQHRVRVALKSYRYLADALRAVWPKITAERLERLHDCQSRMGELHDVRLFEARLAKFAARRESAAGFGACQWELARRRAALERAQRRISVAAHGFR